MVAGELERLGRQGVEPLSVAHQTEAICVDGLPLDSAVVPTALVCHNLGDHLAVCPGAIIMAAPL